MSIKNIICRITAMAAAVSCAGALAVSAAGTYSVERIDINSDTQIVTVKCKADSSLIGKQALLLVTEPDSEPDSIQIQRQDQIKIETEEFVFSFKLHQTENDKGGTYKVYVSVDGIKTESEFVFTTQTELGSALEALLAARSESEFLSAMTRYEGALGVINSLYSGVSKSQTAGIAYKELKADPDSYKTASDIQKLILNAASVTAFNENKTELVVSDAVNFIYADKMGLEDFKTLHGSTAYELYLHDITDTGKRNVITAVAGKGFSTIDHFNKAFAESAVINALKNNKMSGTGHIDPILKDNEHYLGLNLSNYNSASAALNIKTLILTASYSDVRGLQNILDTAGKNNSQSGGGSGGGGGGSNLNGMGIVKEPIPQIEPINTAEPEKVLPFDDISSYDWAETAILHLYNTGVVNGKADRIFAPGDTITREEFVKMLTGILELELIEPGDEFTDVDNGQWYAPYIYTAVEAGIVNGYDNHTFGVGVNITREDTAVMTARALSAREINLTLDKSIEFTDTDSISGYAVEAVGMLSRAGVINGMPDGSFMPKDNCTRAAAAVMLYNAFYAS